MASRPHFHIGGHVHHDSTHHHDHHANHSHGHRATHVTESDRDDALPLGISPLGDHDSDALYCGESVTLARDGNSVTVHAEKDVSTAVLFRVSNQGDGLLRLGPLRGQPPSVFHASCPIYLRTLSLRL